MYEMIVIPLFYCYNFLFLFWIFYFFIFIALQCKPLKDEKNIYFSYRKKRKILPDYPNFGKYSNFFYKLEYNNNSYIIF